MMATHVVAIDLRRAMQVVIDLAFRDAQECVQLATNDDEARRAADLLEDVEFVRQAFGLD